MNQITIAYGDGIGPEIMKAVLHILEKAKVPLKYDVVEIGEKVYQKGFKTGIDPAIWEIIRKNRVLLKAPITTPQGGGFKSLNVTIRTTLGLYANIRPCLSFSPFIRTKHPRMDVVIIRENEEDLYAGIEYQQSLEVCHSVKLISRPGSEKIVRYAFEYAKHNGRKKVACFTKDNIMKLSDGLFHEVFEEIAKEYPEIESQHWIVDIGAARLADSPEIFDVIVLPNLYGDILSDVAAQISGSVGIAGSANIGPSAAMFEAIHGSAPLLANKNIANPTALLFGALLMLRHLKLDEYACTIENAWRKTIEDGIHTEDIFQEGVSKKKVGTDTFANEVADRLGMKPQELPVATKGSGAVSSHPITFKKIDLKKKLMGADFYIEKKCSANEFIENFAVKKKGQLSLNMITNRGVRVWPQGQKETFCVDQWRCRYLNIEKAPLSLQQVLELAQKLVQSGYDLLKIENLYSFNDKPAFSQFETW
ncbi:MAG: NADP-dependent isocitrate dehydrogenase [Simkaniaceae bacterium]